MRSENCEKCKKEKTGGTVCRYYKDSSRQQNASYQLAAGTVLDGRYLIGRVLGVGGFGITYLGWDMQMDSRIAVKEFFPSGMALRDISVSAEVKRTGADAEMNFDEHKERFLREYQTLAGLSDIANIVQVKNYFTENNTAYIVMEYVEGITLKQYVEDKGGRLLAKEVFEMLEPIRCSLVKIHEAGLVHRDISPENLIVLADGKVKLLDFGAARKVRKDAVAEKSLTKSTVVIYKHGYAPLEQYQDRGGLGPWTDVYAYCATICFCLTGNVPPDALERLLQDVPVQLREKGADVSEYEESVLLRGMELRAGDRISDMRKLAEALLAKPETPCRLPEQDDSISVKALTGKAGEGSWDRKKTTRADWKQRRFIPALILGAAVSLGGWAIWNLQNLQPESDSNKAITAPVYYGRMKMDAENYDEYGTWISLNCGEVTAFSESYTYSCCLYIPKAVCAQDSSQIWVSFWMDLCTGEEVIGTTDSIYSWKLLNESGEIFPVVEDSAGILVENFEYDKFFYIQEEGDYYKLEITDLPYNPKMHVQKEGWRDFIAIDTQSGGQIVVNTKVSGISALSSCNIYLDDIAVKDNGTVIKSYDCSAESLYGRGIFCEYDGEDGEKIQMNDPKPEKIRLWGGYTPERIFAKRFAN